jgi:hypothetical protein
MLATKAALAGLTQTLPRPIAAGCVDRGDADIQRRGDLAVAPALTRFGYVRMIGGYLSHFVDSVTLQCRGAQRKCTSRPQAREQQR